ncbi:NTE family protein [Saccharicrinis carchari]|uniref:NTE family protein n=1 Tax=Saccharicrinis carchari TaxID=1168039 RepID=A0A521AIQ9_SACCC|nr:patatin-like phospholipase family protein [Saccharicrinis carchari]SMO34725.1 NTE family protein [Saccharicrinis carchari]
MDNKKIGIALSGGGARGIAHIGVLKALEEYKIEPAYVSGTSMGAIVGVLFAAGLKADEIATLFKDEKIFKWFKVEWFKPGFLSLAGLKEILLKYIGHNKFDKLQRHFFVAVTNLNLGKGQIIQKGDKLIDWVIASAGLPVVFAPVQLDGYMYVDGGVFHNLPAEALLGECDFIIGSNVNPVSRDNKVESAKQVGERVFNLSVSQNVLHSRSYCDFFIEPRDIINYSLWDYFKIDELIEVGYTATQKVIERFILPEFGEPANKIAR